MNGQKTTIGQLRKNVKKAEEELRIAEEKAEEEAEREKDFTIDSGFLPLPWELGDAPGGQDRVTDADGEIVFEVFTSGAEDYEPLTGLECMISRINDGLRCKRELEKLRKVNQLGNEHVEPEEEVMESEAE
jgi:hypothetical protein